MNQLSNILRFTVIMFCFFVLYDCKKNNYINDYGNYLNINFPTDLDIIDIKQNSNFQDFDNTSLYFLTISQRDSLIKEIEPKLCDSAISKNLDCWEKCENIYSLKTSDSTLMSGYYLKVIVTTGEINTLLIKEVKWK